MLTIVAAENQRGIGESLAAAGASVNLGWHEQVHAEMVAEKVRELVRNVEGRAQLAANAKKLVDGNGASRVANTIVRLMRGKCEEKELFPGGSARLRPLEARDIETIFRWRNSAKVRRYMFNTSEIKWEDHCKWFQKTQQAKRTMFFVFEWNARAFGAVYFDESPEDLTGLRWGFYVAPEHENAGYGSVMGFMGLSLAFGDLGASSVIGEVLEFNVKSIDFHRKLGFSELGTRRSSANGPAQNVLVFQIRADEWRAARDSTRSRVSKGRPELAWLT